MSIDTTNIQNILMRYQQVCAFRMALKDLYANRVTTAASRIIQELDKVSSEDCKVLRKWCKSNS